MAFYQQRFANAADFTFFFVGAFKVDEITPLLDDLPRRRCRRRGDARRASSATCELQFPRRSCARR